MKLKQIKGSRGTAAEHDAGTGAGNVVQLDAAGKLPAVDASQLSPAPTVSGGSESSSSIPKYDLIDVSHSTTITITSSSPATLKSMNVYLIDMSVASSPSVYLPPAADLDAGEYVVIVHKSSSTSAGRTTYLYVYPPSGETLYTHNNNTFYRTRQTGSASFVSDGVSTWYQGPGIGNS